MRILSILVIFILAPVAAGAQQAELPAKKNRCSVCGHDPLLMNKFGFNHGPFIYATSSSDEIEREYTWRATWMETEHFRIGGDFPEWKIPAKEKKAYRVELGKLEDKYPNVKSKKIKTLDRWQRIHLYAERMESLYSTVADIVGAEPELFESKEQLQRYGLGAFLGQKDKYEIMVFEERNLYREFMTITWGLGYVKPQRWNNTKRDVLWYGLNLEEENVKHDQHLHNIIRHGVSHNLLDGYMHYSFELPVWLSEGFAHWCDRQNDNRFDLFCTVEGSFHKAKALEKWRPEVRKIAAANEATTFAALLRRTSFSELLWEDHLICWSKVDFLISEHKDKFATFITALCSKRNAQGLPDGSNMAESQRKAFKVSFGWDINQAEREWSKWVLKNYPSK